MRNIAIITLLITGKHKLSVTDFLIKACSKALIDVPEVNSQWADTTIRQYVTRRERERDIDTRRNTKRRQREIKRGRERGRERKRERGREGEKERERMRDRERETDEVFPLGIITLI